MAERHVQIESRRLHLRNLEKVMYPGTGFTKAQVIDYYARVAPVMLPHLKDRPITLKRYPDGVEGAFFFQKNCPSHRPDWLPTVRVPSPGGRSEAIEFCLLNDIASVVWAANLASLELHVYLHRAEAPDRPTLMVFDLDPGPPAGFGQCVKTAFELRTMLEHLNLHAYPKTSGGKGLHLYVPMPQPVDYERTKSLARSLAQAMTRRRPAEVTDRMSKTGRSGKVFVDWSQNTQSKTTVSVYSLRAQPRPSVSTPVTWDELKPWLRRPRRAAPVFAPADVLDRVQRHGDLAAPLLEVARV